MKSLQIINEPIDYCIKIPEHILPYKSVSDVSEIIIYSSCIKVVCNESNVYTLPMNVSIPKNLPKLHSVVSYNGGYQTICAYSFNDTIYASYNNSMYLPTRNLSVYFTYSDPVVDKDNVIIYRRAKVPIYKLDDFNSELSESEKQSFYRCLGLDTTTITTNHCVIDTLVSTIDTTDPGYLIREDTDNNKNKSNYIEW